jgi:lysozyme family protein
MALFGIAIGKTLLFEGGYSNTPGDSGGETYEGISRNNWPNWEGWPIVDAAPNKNALSLKLAAQQAVVNFYRQNFWQYDGINDQDVANKVFDLTVNVGKVHGVKILQQAAGVATDGLYGPNTERATNAHPIGSLSSIIRIAAESYHEQVVQSHPEDAKFLADWLRRDAS